MAKLMDVLKKREAAPAPVASPEDSCRCAADECAPEESLPFIEIDGVTRMLAGSPGVLPVPISLVSDRKPQPPEPTRAAPSQAVAAALAYQPWPGATAADPERLAPELVVFHDPESPASRQYVQLLEQVLQTERPPQALLFTAPPGASALAVPVLNLAIAACQQKHRKAAVLGVEGKPPTVTGCLGLPPAPGLQQVLEGKIALEQALQTSPVANLSVLPIAGNHAPGVVWNRDALRWVIGWLRQRFHFVFLDVGAWQGTPEQVLLANLCDAVYPVLHGADGRQVEAGRFIQAIVAQGGPVRGVINMQAK